MKKYLMTGMAAVIFGVAFTSCSHDLGTDQGTVKQTVEETYEKAFVTHFGQPASTQTWGFGSAVAGTRAIDPDQEQRAEPRGNEWAATWSVPDTLTDGQKLRAQKYFQYNQYPGGTPDPDLVDFFVQQVYDGHDDPLTDHDQTMLNDTLKYSTEEYLAASGTVWIQSGEHMDKLTAGSDNIHINNFNNGNCGVYGNVLDNGYEVNDNGEHHHPDKIMLMLNTKTDCFGYWNSNGSCGHNDRYRLVSAAVIDEWIDANLGKDFGDPVVDKWNRHFIGFDFDQLPDSACYAYSGNDIKMATLNDGPHGGYQYVWDGTNVIPVNSVAGVADNDITSRFYNNGSPLFWGNNQSVNYEDGTYTYNATQWGGWKADLSFQEISNYKKVVVVFAEPITAYTQFCIPVNENWSITSGANAGATRLELSISDNFYNLQSLGQFQIAIQSGNFPNGVNSVDIKISSIYLEGEPAVQGYGQYLIVDNEQVPILHSDNNLYCGETKKKDNGDFNEQDDSNTANNGIYGYHNGVLCLNLPFINKMVRDGYLPVDTKNFREWTKVGGCADGYYSDWIVTIAKANPKGETPPPSDEGDEIMVIAEDLTIDDAKPDFDFNDVVFKVKWNKTANTVNVTLLAAGGTLPLYIGGTKENDYTDGYEVHAKFAEANTDKVITTGTMINTYENRHDQYKTITFEVTNFNHDAKDIGTIANSIKVAVKKYGEMIELTAPAGRVPTKIGVGTDFEWCDERQDIDEKYKLIDGTPLFKNYVQGIIGNDWYRMIKDDIDSTKQQ